MDLDLDWSFTIFCHVHQIVKIEAEIDDEKKKGY